MDLPVLGAEALKDEGGGGGPVGEGGPELGDLGHDERRHRQLPQRPLRPRRLRLSQCGLVTSSVRGESLEP